MRSFEMKKQNEIVEEYDFSKGIRGKYAEQYNDGVNIIKLDKDVSKIFPDAQSVNNALRTLINLIPKNKIDLVESNYATETSYLILRLDVLAGFIIDYFLINSSLLRSIHFSYNTTDSITTGAA